MQLSKLPRVMERRRGAFTLIELLVVISIIAVLAALLLAGVMAVMSKPAAVQTRADISQLGTAIAKFKQNYGLFPPHYIRLRSYAEDYVKPSNPTPDYIDQDSISFIRRMFPNIGNFGKDTPPIKWDGNAAFPKGSPGVFLGPDQCLVFFLGGIPTYPTAGQPPFLIGFDQNPKDPGIPTASVDMTRRKGPFYEFPSHRLKSLDGSNFTSYIDPFGEQPYVFFSSTNRYGASNPQVNMGFKINGSSVFFAPFFSAPGRFVNAESFQVISAGTDKAFGIGGLWSANNAAAYLPPGKDDMANFHSNLLGVP